MEQNPSRQANSRSASQEIHSRLWNPKIHYSVHKSQPLVPVLIQMNRIQSIPSHIFKIHFNIILPSMPRFSKSHRPLR